MDLKDAVAALKAAPKDEVVKAISEDLPGVKQVLFQEGYDNAYGKREGELTKVNGELTEAKAKVTTLTTENETLKKNPDTAALHADYKKQIDEMKDTHRKDLESRDGTVQSMRMDRVRDDLKALLKSGDKRVREAWADVLVEKPDVLKRIHLSPDGKHQILQAGKTIPLGADTFDAALKLLAEELKATVPADGIAAGTDAGGGAGGNAGAGGGGGGGAPALYDGIRKDVETEAKAQAPVTHHGPFAGLAQPIK